MTSTKALITLRDNKRLTVQLLGAAAVVALFLIAFWPDSSPRIFIAGTGPVYESVESLSAEADLVAIGVVEEVALRKIEESTDLPFVYFHFSVQEVLGQKRPAGAADTIIVSTLDTDKVVLDRLTPLNPGQSVMLFLKEIRAVEAPPGLVPFDRVYVPLSHDNGVFDVIDADRIRARSEAVLSITDAQLEDARDNLPTPEVDENGRETVTDGARRTFPIEDIRPTLEAGAG